MAHSLVFLCLHCNCALSAVHREKVIQRERHARVQRWGQSAPFFENGLAATEARLCRRYAEKCGPRRPLEEGGGNQRAGGTREQRPIVRGTCLLVVIGPACMLRFRGPCARARCDSGQLDAKRGCSPRSGWHQLREAWLATLYARTGRRLVTDPHPFSSAMTRGLGAATEHHAKCRHC